MEEGLWDANHGAKGVIHRIKGMKNRMSESEIERQKRGDKEDQIARERERASVYVREKERERKRRDTERSNRGK